jgi:hypothetical protein
VIYLLVCTTKQSSILFLLQYAVHFIHCCSRTFHIYVCAVYCLFITVTILLNKDNTTNIITQPYAFHCRRRKDGITKRRLSYRALLSLVKKNRKFRYLPALKAQRKILIKKDNTTNITTQPYAVHCRRRKDGIKRSISYRITLYCHLSKKKQKVRYLLGLKAQRKTYRLETIFLSLKSA